MGGSGCPLGPNCSDPNTYKWFAGHTKARLLYLRVHIREDLIADRVKLFQQAGPDLGTKSRAHRCRMEAEIQQRCWWVRGPPVAASPGLTWPNQTLTVWTWIPHNTDLSPSGSPASPWEGCGVSVAWCAGLAGSWALVLFPQYHVMPLFGRTLWVAAQ